MREKVLAYACLPLIGAAGGYAYLVRVLRPASPAVACIMVQPDSWRCSSYQVIVSKPFFLLAGALIGTWIAYALVRTHMAATPQNVTWREALVAAAPLLAITAWIIALHPGVTWNWGDGLGWWRVLVFFVAAVLIRLAIGIASLASVRGGLALAFGLPIILAGLGYSSITSFQLPPVGHSCPAFRGESSRELAYACTFHPLIGTSGPWVLLGLLAGLWLAYALAAGLAGSQPTSAWKECAIVLPIMIAAIWWALVVGPDQAGEGYVFRFVFAVCLAALLRLLLGARRAKMAVPGVLAKLGMVRRMAAEAPR